jgi:hypothetical protein
MRRPSHKYLNGWDSVSLLSVGIGRHRSVPPSINQMARPSIVRCPLLGARARTFIASSADKKTHD